MKLFLDTEFCRNQGGYELLSIGLVGGARPFYAELDAEGRAGVFRKTRPSRFVRDAVLSQFGWPMQRQFAPDAMAQEAARWLRDLGSTTLEVHYDYVVDFDLLEGLMSRVEASLVPRLLPVHIGYLLEDADGEAAAKAVWAHAHAEYGVHRHHALWDAMALKARYEAVHGRL